MRISGILLGLILIAAPVRADDPPYLLADVDRVPLQGSSAFLPAQVSGFFQLGDRLLFSTVLGADNGTLWSTDGTAQGTLQLSSSLCLAGCGGVEPLPSWRELGLFGVLDGPNGYSSRRLLARTDGTPGGTFLLSPRVAIDPGSFISWELQASEDLPFFFFNGCLPQGGCHLWRSDGSVAGTQRVTATDGLPFDAPEQLVLWHGRLWFVASHGPVYNHGLWSTDGTPEGTTFLHDIAEDQNDGARIEATPGHLFFSTGENGEDLWVTDGSPESTRRLADFEPDYCHPSCSSQDVNSMKAIDGQIYFWKVGGPEHGIALWHSDGTENGTGPLLALPAEVARPYGLLKVGDSWMFTVYSSTSGKYSLWTLDSGLTRAAPLSGCQGGTCPTAGSLVRLGPGTLFFQGLDPEHGNEPWVTDGTGPGTRRLADVCPGSCDGMDPGIIVPDVSVSPSGGAWFQGFTTGYGQPRQDELWATDGTPGGTRRVWGHFAGVGFLNGRVYFGSQRVSTGAVEIWSADGPTAATRRVRPLRRFAPGSHPEFQAVRDGVLMTADAGRGRQALWKSDGTPEKTFLFFEFPADGSRWAVSFLAPAGRVQILDVYHENQGGAGEEEIWRTDGTRDGTWRIHRLLPQESVGPWTSWAGRSLFEVRSLQSCSLWSTDGTEEGTRKILFPLPGVGCPGAMTGFGSQFLFVSRTADTPGAGVQIFASDGTPEGTRRLSDLRHYREADDYGTFVQAGGLVFFRLFHGYTTELWRTDGTLEGTRPIFPELDAPDDLTVFRGSLYLTAQIQGSYWDRGLYRAPLRGGKPVLLARVARGFGYGAELFHLEAQLSPAGDRLVFQAMDPRHGIEPWVTDGTREGTHMLADLLPGPDGSWADDLASGGGKVFFRARDLTGGEELWETDGTATGTRKVQEIAPGGASSSPAKLTVANGFLFFAADDGRTGVEPWALKLDP